MVKMAHEGRENIASRILKIICIHHQHLAYKYLNVCAFFGSATIITLCLRLIPSILIIAQKWGCWSPPTPPPPRLHPCKSYYVDVLFIDHTVLYYSMSSPTEYCSPWSFSVALAMRKSIHGWGWGTDNLFCVALANHGWSAPCLYSPLSHLYHAYWPCLLQAMCFLLIRTTVELAYKNYTELLGKE